MPKRIENGRHTADIQGDFVVFLIGMRFNRLLKVHKWWPVFAAMPEYRYEHLFIDNASTDSTEAICAECVHRDQRVRYVRNAENIGATTHRCLSAPSTATTSARSNDSGSQATKTPSADESPPRSGSGPT